MIPPPSFHRPVRALHQSVEVHHWLLKTPQLRDSKINQADTSFLPDYRPPRQEKSVLRAI
jgi:hypothetical protein